MQCKRSYNSKEDTEREETTQKTEGPTTVSQIGTDHPNSPIITHLMSSIIHSNGGAHATDAVAVRPEVITPQYRPSKYPEGLINSSMIQPDDILESVLCTVCEV